MKYNKIKRISLIILVCCIAMVAIFIGVTSFSELRFRTWISILVYVVGMYGIPVSLYSFILSALLEKKHANQNNKKGILAQTGVVLSNGLLIIILLMVTGFTLIFGSGWGKEERVAGNIIRETKKIWLDSNVYYTYYRANPIFKSRCMYNDTNVIQAILEEHYQEKFIIQSVEDNVGETIFEVKTKDSADYVFHMFAAQKGLSPLHIDNYSSVRANKRAKEYIGEGSRWEIRAVENEETRLASGFEVVCRSKEDAKDCSSYVAGMIAYVLEDPFFKDHASCFRIVYSEGDEMPETIDFWFGLSKYIKRDNYTYDYYADKENVYHDLLEEYTILRERALKREAEAAAAEKEKQQMEEVVQEEEEAQEEWQPMMTDEEGMLTPEGAYEKLYEEVFKSQGDEYTCTYNAKGNFYGVLGEEAETIDGAEITTRRTVVYDRRSKNDKCQLFVYYKEYYNETGNYQTAILNFYAVDMSTGKIIEGNKTAWAEVASKEYQEATGDM